MDDEIDFEILENEAIDGRIFLQFFSGDILNRQCKIDCLNRLCTLQGRMKLSKGKHVLWNDYSFSLEMARDFSVKSVPGSDADVTIPKGVNAKRIMKVEASDFPYHLPVDKLTIFVISGTYEASSPLLSSEISKQVCLLKVIVAFKPLELITRPASLTSYSIDEVVFDKLTILRGRLGIPRPFIQNDVYLEVGSPTPSHLQHRSPRTLSSPEYSNKKGHASSKSAITMNWLRKLSSLSIEFFVLFLVILLWLIVRSHYLTETNYHWFTLYSIVFILTASLAIFSFRGIILKTILKQLAPPECNGRTFFVNGWNTWSFCGSILQGHPPPIYSMPSVFVKAFHDGGVGTALPINLGYGEAPEFQSASATNQHSKDFANKLLQKNLFDEGMHSPDRDNEVKEAQPVPFTITTGSYTNEDEHPRTKYHIPHINMTPSTSVIPTVDIVSNARDYHLAAKDYIASDMFTTIADTRSKCGLVIGFLSQKEQFGCIAVNKNYDRVSVHVSGDGTVVSNAIIQTDWLCLYTINTLEAPFRVYMSMSSRENNVYPRTSSPAIPINSVKYDPTQAIVQQDTSITTVLPTQFTSYPPFSPTIHTNNTSTSHSPTNTTHKHTTIPAGWCSWYHYYDKISEHILRQNLTSMKQLTRIHCLDSARQSFKLFQIDDGYQSAWGDWTSLNKAKFPAQSMQQLVTEIQSAHFTPGLWLAPFSCDKHSQLAKLHPEWVLKRNNSTTTPANSANCGKFFYGLDTTHPEVQAHLRETFTTTTNTWGFEYLKLDFLYSAVLGNAHDSHYDRTLTNAQIMQQAMALVRNSVGKKVFLLGCGAPLGSLIGHVDANRVSADAGSSWHPEFPLPRSDKWNLPCARNCVRNTLTRLFMHQYWWINDPDCLLLRENTSFSLDELRGIATSKALSGGSFILSDDLNTLSAERLRIALQLLPPAPLAAVAIDLLEKETPELFRMSLRSNFAHQALFHAEQCENFDVSCLNTPAYNTISAHTTNKISVTNNNAIMDDSAPVTPEKPQRVYRNESDNSVIFNSALNNPLFQDVEDIHSFPATTAITTTANTAITAATIHNNHSFAISSPPAKSEYRNAQFYDLEDVSPPLSPTSHTSNNNNNHITTTGNFSKVTMGSLSLSLSRCNSPQRPAPLSNYTHNHTLNTNNSTNTHANSHTSSHTIHPTSTNSVPNSPRISRKHSFEKGLMLRASSDLNLLRKQRRKVKEILREENAINEDDLLGEYTLFTACNWSDVPKKDYFVSLRQIFGVEYIAQLVARGVLFENLLRLQRYAAAQKAEKARRDKNLSKPERAHRGISQLSDTPRYLMHLFNFWTEHYSYRVVTLEEEEDCEIALLNIPAHSAHIYSVSLTTDPTLPKYVGSNLHFTCGTEIHRIYLTAVPEQADLHLKNIFFGQEFAPFEVFSPSSIDTDCAFADGFGPVDVDDLFTNNNHMSNISHTQHQHQQNSSTTSINSVLSPVIRSMCVTFEEGSLRDANWGGYIWVFLPVNGLNPQMTNNNFGRIHVTGSAVESLQPSSTQPSYTHTYTPGRRGISSQRVEESSVLLATHVRAPDCRIFGDVYRMAVCRSKSSAARQDNKTNNHKSASYFDTKDGPTVVPPRMQVSPLPLSRTHSNQDVYNPIMHKSSTSDDDKDFVVISWVYDVREGGDVPK